MSDTVVRKLFAYTSTGRKLVHPETSASAVGNLPAALEAFFEEKVGALSELIGDEQLAPPTNWLLHQHPASAIAADDGKSVQEHIDGLTAVVSGTYAEIKSLRDTSRLIPGNLYRITDYETIYVQPVTNIVRSDSSALFDVALLATDKDRFAPEAWATHTDRTQPSGSVITSTTPLHQWRLLYDIDNNSALYSWATSTGKGVIYRLVDHWLNDLPYDFYNVKFRRYKITGTTTVAVSLVGQYLSLGPTKTGFTVDSGDYVDLLTFDWTKDIRRNRIPQTPIEITSQKYLLNITFGGECTDNEFGGICLNNVFVGTCRANNFNSRFYGNIVNGDCSSNLFMPGCYNNTFGGACQLNTFGTFCYDNVFADTCATSTFGGQFYSNVFDGDCSFNTFGTFCNRNNFGGDCYRNTFGDSFNRNTTGTGLLNFVQFLPGITSRDFSSKDIYDKAYNQTIQKKAPSGGVISVWFDASNQQQVASL